MSTPHNTAERGDFGETVIMPGDPLRSKFIAENFLTDAKLVNSVRGINGYTGYYKGKRVSVMASGMGMPSMGIYSYELFNYYDVKNIIRVGTTGSIQEKVKVRELVLAEGACTTSAYASSFGISGTFAPIASFGLLRKAVEIAESFGYTYHVGNIMSSDVFYSEIGETENSGWTRMGILAIDMETAALYMNAARYGKNALSICTVSNHILTGEETTAEERQNSFTDMMKVALETALAD